MFSLARERRFVMMGSTHIVIIVACCLIYSTNVVHSQDCGTGCSTMQPGSPWILTTTELKVEQTCFMELGTSSIAAQDLSVTLDFDSSVNSVEQWDLLKTSAFQYTNQNTMTPSGTYVWSFQVLYPGTITYWPVAYQTPPPTGKCYFTIAGSSGTTVTTTTSTTTTISPPTSPITTTTTLTPTTPTTTTTTSTTPTTPTTTTTSTSTTTPTTPTTTTTTSTTPTTPTTAVTTTPPTGCSTCADVEQDSAPWPDSGQVLVQGKCSFYLDTTYAAGDASIKLTLDSDIQDIANWKFSIDWPSIANRPDNEYYLTNYGAITDTQPFEWVFHMRYDGSVNYNTGVGISTPPPPTGTCEFISNTGVPPGTQTPTTTTTTSATTTSGSTTTPGSTVSTDTPTTTTTGAATPLNFDVCRSYTTVTSKDNDPNWNFNYYEVLCKSILFYEAQRSGELPANQRATWRLDSALQDGSTVGVNLTGGWYDAGDYVKFGFPMAGATTILLWGFLQWKPAYDAAGQTEYMYDSVKWPLDYFVKCWDNGVFYGQVGDGDIDHAVMERVEEMTTWRPAYPLDTNNTGSDLAAETASALAIGYLVFKDRDLAYANTLLQTARELYTFADEYRGIYSVSISDADAFYKSEGYMDELAQAAAWLYKVTNENSYKNDAISHYASLGSYIWTYNWENKALAANILLYEITGDSQYATEVRTYLQRWASGNDPSYSGGGLAYRDEWGVLRLSANSAFASLMSVDVGIVTEADITNGAYLNPYIQIDYALGVNPRNSSYMVGFGYNYPQFPHHKSSTCSPSPDPCDWPQFSNTSTPNYYIVYGALVGGPDIWDNYDDNRNTYVRSEVSCDYNAGFQSAVAGIISRDVARKK